MFKKNKEVNESVFVKAKKKAIEAGDWETVDMLNEVDKEHSDKLFKERLKCMVIGAGLTHIGFAIGAVAVALATKKD